MRGVQGGTCIVFRTITRFSSAERLVAFLAFMNPDDSVLATGEVRSALAASLSVSWNNSGAKVSRRCHSK